MVKIGSGGPEPPSRSRPAASNERRPDLGEARQHVELRQRQRRDPVDAHREAQSDEVEPAAAALASGDGAELATELADALLRAPLDLARERPFADAGHVRLGDSSTLIDLLGPMPKLTAAPAAIGLEEVTNGYVP